MIKQPRPMTDDARERLSPGGLRTFEGMAKRLGLSVDEAAAVLAMPGDVYRSFVAAAQANQPVILPENALLAISHFMNLVDQVLWIAGPNEAKWIRRQHALLGDKSLIDCITSGLSPLIAVRQLLEENASSF